MHNRKTRAKTSIITKSKYIEKNYHTSNSFPGFACSSIGRRTNLPRSRAVRKSPGGRLAAGSPVPGRQQSRGAALPAVLASCFSLALSTVPFQHIFKSTLQDTLFTSPSCFVFTHGSYAQGHGVKASLQDPGATWTKPGAAYRQKYNWSHSQWS